MGVLGGILLGLFMPIDVAVGERQEVINWLFRTGVFSAVGFITGAASHSARAYLERISHAARHDTISGLANRVALIEELEKIKRRALGTSALAIVSLENASELKIAFGLSVVDELVDRLAHRIFGLTGCEMKVFRVSVHQLGVLFFEDGKDRSGILKVRQELPDLLEHPFEVEGLSVHADVRIGYAEIEDIDEHVELYLRRCELALEDASKNSRMVVRFDPKLEDNRARNNVNLLGALSEALAIARAVKDAGEGIILMGLANSAFEGAAAEAGVPFAAEAFADRAYEPDGSLVSRKKEGAVIHDVNLAAERVLRMLKEGAVEAIDGSLVSIRPHTICLHGDTPEAVEMARKLRRKLETEGVVVCPLKEVMGL